MLDHHLQRTIVYRLAFEPGLRFSELKPDTLENKLFDYHLKRLIAGGLVEKQADGTYGLTAEGRLMGLRSLESPQVLANRAESVLFLVIRRLSDGAWLLYRRKVHPLKDRIGFMHAVPNTEEISTETAARTCKEKTGLNCTFSQLGGGFFRIYNDQELESFTHFELCVCEDAQGELQEQDELAEYAWFVDPDFSAAEMLPNMQILADAYSTGQDFFIEKTLQA